MSIQATCNDCGQPWAVVPSIMKAHPGYRTEPALVRTQDDDGRHVQALSDRWISQGPSANLAHTQTEAETTYRWSCLCGAAMAYIEPRQYLVPCIHGARDGGTCAVSRERGAPSPSATFRRIGSCECCGLQGTHWVAWGESARCGATPPTA